MAPRPAFSATVRFCWTTNRTVFLTDPTGNRRSWPLRTRNIDVPKLRSIRGALFAEALQLYRAGERWWPDREEERTLFKPEQDERFDGDEWEPLIVAYLVGKDRVLVGQIARDACWVTTDKIGRATQNRIIEILERIGWRRGKADERGNGGIVPFRVSSKADQ